MSIAVMLNDLLSFLTCYKSLLQSSRDRTEVGQDDSLIRRPFALLPYNLLVLIIL